MQNRASHSHLLSNNVGNREHSLCDATLYIFNHMKSSTKTCLFRSLLGQESKERHLCMWQLKCSFTNQTCEKKTALGFVFTAYETTPSRPHLALFTCLFLLMSFLGVAMYCTDRRRPQRVCEELEAALAVYLLHMKQLLWGCWIWLTMQWLRPTTGGDMEPALFFSRPVFFPIMEGAQAHKHLRHLARLCTLSAVLNHSHGKKEEKCVTPEICSLHICLYICWTGHSLLLSCNDFAHLQC